MSMWTRAWVAAATLMCLSMTLPAHAGAGVSHYIDNADVLFSTNPQPADQAGFSVAISETHAVVGAYYAAGFESFTGNAFVYEYTPDEDDYTPDWTYVVDLAGLPGMGVLTATDGFGYDVDINGDRIVVSAPGYGDGSVFVFREIADDWTLEETIDNPLFQAAWSFGLSVSIENDLVVIGDPYYDNGSSTGLVWPFSVGGGMRNALPLPPSDGRSGRGFILHYIGWSVDLDEDLLVVGAPGTNVDGVANVGMAYAYRILEDGTYYFEGFLDTPDDWVGVPTQFGFSISADGFEDVVAVGGPNGELGSGIVGVFRKNERTWEEDAVLQDRPVVDLTEFGRSVSVDGNLIVVGVPKASDNGSGSGHASVFRYSPSGATWSYEDTIVPYGTDTNAWFGTSVDVIGNRFIGGAPLLRLGGITVAQVGAAYVYTQQDNGDWQSDTRPALPVKIAEQSIESPLAEAAPDDLSSFGYDVAISGNVALVGDPTGYYSKLGGGAGLVHVYTRSSIESPWIYDAKNLIPVPDDIAIDDGFGFSVAMEGDLAVVGAPGWQISSSPGSAWLFERNPSTGAWGTGIEIRTGSASEHVGWSVAISEDPDGDHVIVVGAPGVNGDVDGGRAYIHMYSDGDGVWDEGYVSPSLSGFYSMFGWCVDAGVSYVDNEIRIAVGDPEFPGQVGTQEDSKYGAVEIFMRSVTGGWYRTTTIDPTADLVSSTNDFGRSLDLNGSLLAVGDPLADLTFEEAGNSKVDSGLAAIYELNAGIWEFRSVFYSPFYQPGDMFGYDVQIHNGGKGEFSRLVATAKGSNYSVSDGGAAVSYIRSDYGPATEWDMERVLLPLNASQDESVGWSVAMDGTSVLVGHGTDTTNDDARVLGFEMNDAISFIATWFSELGSAEAWNTPPDWGQQITAVFSLWLAEPHVVDFFTPLGYLWNGSLLVELDDVTLQIRPEGALVSGSVSVAGEATLRSAVLQVEGESFLEILGDLVVGPENYAGQLVLDQESIVVRGNLELGPDSACKTVLFDLINSDDPMLIADDVDIKGSLAVELGEIDPATLSEGDQWTIISSDTIPPSGSDRFSVVILPAISESLAFQLSYGAPAARDDESTRGSWTVVIDVVNIADLFDFGESNTTALDGAAVALEVVDLNGDSADEICVIYDGTPGQLAIYENDGTGGVDQVVVYNTGDEPVDITSGDFDDNGSPDLAVANYLSADISILFNEQGDPTDLTSGDFSPGVLPTCLTSFDYLGIDDLDDLVIGFEALASSGGGFVIYSPFDSLRGTGFGNQQTLFTSGVPIGVDPAEDEDDKDLPFTGAKNNGKAVAGRVIGALTAAGPTIVLDEYDAAAGLVDIVLDDIDGNTLADMVITSETNNTIVILLQDSTNPGLFEPAIQVPAGTGPTSLTSIDFDGDGNMDLATTTTNLAGSEIIRVLKNDGGLSFTSIDLAEGTSPILVDTGDVDGDGINDMVCIADSSALLRGAAPEMLLWTPDGPCECQGDVDCNGAVDVEDLLDVIANYGCTQDCIADVNDDGLVDVEDVLVVISGWGDCS